MQKHTFILLINVNQLKKILLSSLIIIYFFIGSEST